MPFEFAQGDGPSIEAGQSEIRCGRDARFFQDGLSLGPTSGIYHHISYNASRELEEAEKYIRKGLEILDGLDELLTRKNTAW